MSELDKLMVGVIESLVFEGLCHHENQFKNRVANRSALAKLVTRRIVAAVELNTTLKEIRHLKENEAMPNAVTFSDEKTIVKAMTAISGDGKLGFQETLEIVQRIQDAGLLFREPRNDEDDKPRAPRRKNADGTESTEVANPERTQVSEPTVETPAPGQ